MFELLTVEEIARMCRLHEMTVRRHIAEGKLRVVRVGRGVRVKKEDLEDYLRPQEVITNQRSINGVGRRKSLAKDDSIFRLMGIVNAPEAATLSEDKYAAFAQSFSPNQ